MKSGDLFVNLSDLLSCQIFFLTSSCHRLLNLYLWTSEFLLFHTPRFFFSSHPHQSHSHIQSHQRLKKKHSLLHHYHTITKQQFPIIIITRNHHHFINENFERYTRDIITDPSRHYVVLKHHPFLHNSFFSTTLFINSLSTKKKSPTRKTNES